ncbi:MAG: toll/interleukin-1 receptor domain-containing protein [Anaerolineales bacterium]|nr:toll/interleukin-1 receptor domain-containing protein [Anaerolineales bacterium]
MIKIFISWSGERSEKLAEALMNWIPRVIQVARPWMSRIDIKKGERWSKQVSESLANHHIGIICVTPENYQAPWLLFEAGALSKTMGYSKVCPLLLGMSADELEGPLREFQATIFDKNDVLQLVKSLNDELGDNKIRQDILTDTFERYWPELEARVIEISKIEIPGTTSTVLSVIKSFSQYGFPEPLIGSNAYFDGGFESHALYSTVTDIADRRLFIFGRKNRKLFDKDHYDFFQSVKQKIDDGFDLKILFLDPDAPKELIECAHQDPDFRDQLKNNIEHSISVLQSYEIDTSKHCRAYKTIRRHGIIIADDAVIYSPIPLDDCGVAVKLT